MIKYLLQELRSILNKTKPGRADTVCQEVCMCVGKTGNTGKIRA